MSFCYVQISTSVLWLIIIVARVAPIVQTLWGHSTAPANLNISGMELNVKVCFSVTLSCSVRVSFHEVSLIKFYNHLEITGCLAVFLVF